MHAANDASSFASGPAGGGGCRPPWTRLGCSARSPDAGPAGGMETETLSSLGANPFASGPVTICDRYLLMGELGPLLVHFQLRPDLHSVRETGTRLEAIHNKEGALQTDMSYTYTPKARVQKPAPHFSGTAVVDGTFEGAYTCPLCSLAEAPSARLRQSTTSPVRSNPVRHHGAWRRPP
jgi:hypothetical protein